METDQPQPLDTWALVEILGRQQIVGRVTEAVIAGAAFIRVDVPAFDGNKPFTRFYGASSIYCISPVEEHVARGLLTQCRFRNQPVSQFDLPQIEERAGTKDSDCPNYCPDCQELEENCRCPD